MKWFEPERHEALADLAWDEPRARAAIDAIVADTQRAYAGPDALWPIHPLDASPERPPVLKPLYYGAAGVVWALTRLGGARAEHVAALQGLMADERQPAYAMGRAGVLLLRWSIEPSDALARELAQAIDANLENPALGFLWGGPGSMLAALFAFERSGDARWRALYLRGCDALWSTWRRDEALRCHLWTQNLYGHVDQQLGALHGFAGNAHASLRGRHLLAPERADEFVRRTRETLHATALRDGSFASWPMCAGPSARPGANALRVQHDMGAPGVVSCLASLPADPETDALLVAAGELTWAAGPLAKAPGLCHGTPGSGYAFLKLHQRTGDPRWLERARRFAMHAIAQSERGLREHGQRKFSLWTGDLGLALYLKSCLAGTSAFPTLDVF